MPSTDSAPALEHDRRDDATGEAISPVQVRLARILEGRDFPALSQQIIETISALDDDASSLQRLTNVVLREYSLTLSVVRTANSAHYRRADRQIQSATRAMLLLGARTVRQLASSLLLFENYARRSAGLKELMLLSLLTANHAREIATKLGRGDPEEAHLCGMFRNLGEVLIACHFSDDYAKIHGLVRNKQQSEGNACFEVLGFRYEELGEAMCTYWGMPDSVKQGMRARVGSFPTESSAITSFAHDITNAIYRRDRIRTDATGREAAIRDTHRDLNEVIDRYSSRLKLSRTQVREVVEAALDETRELFVNAKVSVDGLRMRELSEAACTALGVPELGNPEWDHVLLDDSEQAAIALRERMRLELESKVDPASECDLGQILLLALEGTLRGGPFDRVVACVLSPDRARLRARSGLGNGVESLLQQFDVPMTPNGGPLAALLLQRKATYLPSDRALNTIELQFASSRGIGQFGVFPIIVAGQIVGCIYADRAVREPLPDRETLQFVASLNELIVRAIEARRQASSDATRRDTAPSTAAVRTPPSVPAAGAAPTAAASAPSTASTSAATGVAASGTTASGTTASGANGLTPEMKGSLVLRLLAGESTATVAASSGVSAVMLEQWRADFLAGAIARLGER